VRFSTESTIRLWKEQKSASLSRFFVFVPIALLAAAAAAPIGGHPLPPIAKGVKIGGISVGGMNAETARVHVERVYGRSVLFKHGEESWRARPAALGAKPQIGRAVTIALRAKRARKIPLRVVFNRKRLSGYVTRLDNRLSEPASDAYLAGLSNLVPVIEPGQPGMRVNRGMMMGRIVTTLRSFHREPIELAVEQVEPEITPDNFGPVIVVETKSNQLLYYWGESLQSTFSVATGQSAYPTPIGQWEIIQLRRDPWWIPPPDSKWAQGAKPIPPGPGNPLGTRWMGLSAPYVGIHGTPDAASLGYSQSHGCIRMAIPDAEWLFDHVSLGTPVFTVAA
jgi:lipoprotein-anchoring transpeptidase ErfK/SrfK